MQASRRSIYLLIITLAVGLGLGRILSAQRIYEPNFHPKTGKPFWPTTRPNPMPTFGSNDRARWATVRNLVDEGTYAVGTRDRILVTANILLPLGNTSDSFQLAAQMQVAAHRHTQIDDGIIFQDGWQTIDRVLHPTKLEFYSSKPPLLSTLIAGLYWLLQQLFGWTLDAHPFAVVRTILVLVNLLPFAGYLYLLTTLLERYGKTDWGKMLVLATAGFATLVTPFLITLNNHTLGTFSVMVSLACLLRIAGQREDAPGSQFALAGFFATFAATNDLPALSFAGLAFLISLRLAPRKTLLVFAPCALVPVVLFFWTNYLAVGQWLPAYSEYGGVWYEYEGSHWKRIPGQIRTGIDFARHHESLGAYVFHLLLGHHGIFSLTPIWLLAGAGVVRGVKRPATAAGELPAFFYPMTMALSAIVFAFYLIRSDNYGGFSNGVRWMMWLTPFWLLCMLPVADRLSTSPWGRRFAYACLAISLLSASYSSWNPWRHPWIFDAMVACGWRGYQ